MDEKEELLQQYKLLQEERDEAKRRNYDHIVRARQYRMKLIEKKLRVIQEKDIDKES